MTNDELMSMLAQKYYKALYQFICRICSDKALVSDVVQDTFLIACEKMDNLQTHQSIEGWLYRTARFRMLQLLVERLNYENLDSLADSMGDNRNYEDECITALEKYPKIAQYLDIAELQLIIKHYEEGYGFRELAREYNTTEASIKMKIQRLKRRLRKHVWKNLI